MAESQQTAPTPLDNSQQVVDRIAMLQETLRNNSPAYESLLHTIHVQLAKDPDVVHLLTEDQIGMIVAGLSKKKDVVIATTLQKSKKTSLKNIGLDQL